MTEAIDPNEAIRLAATITDDQLAHWMAYPDGREATIDAMGFEVIMSPTGRAAFRHRVAVDPDAAAKCHCWEGPPPACDLTPPPPEPAAWRWNPSKRRPGWGVVIGPYDDRFRELIKERVPPRAREWNGALRAWLVRDDYRAVVEEIAQVCS